MHLERLLAVQRRFVDKYSDILEQRAGAIAKLFFTYVERATLLGVLFALLPPDANEMSFLQAAAHWQVWLVVAGTSAFSLPLLIMSFRFSMRRAPPIGRHPVEWVLWGFVTLTCASLAAFAMNHLAFRIGRLLASIAS